MKEESIGKLLFRGFRMVVLLLVSLFSFLIAICAAKDGNWDMGIFFLLIVMITDKSMDEIIKKANENSNNQ